MVLVVVLVSGVCMCGGAGVCKVSLTDIAVLFKYTRLCAHAHTLTDSAFTTARNTPPFTLRNALPTVTAAAAAAWRGVTCPTTTTTFPTAWAKPEPSSPPGHGCNAFPSGGRTGGPPPPGCHADANYAANKRPSSPGHVAIAEHGNPSSW